MKNWVLRYSLYLILSGVIASCTHSTKSVLTQNNKGNTDVISIATDAKLDAFDFYSNDAFSKFIKDLVCEPICYYDPTYKEIKSKLIANFRWVHESELELTINPNVFFQSSSRLAAYQSRKVLSEDIVHSIKILRKNTKYQQVKEFLSTFEKMTIKSPKQVVISLKKSVNAQEFMMELACLEVAIIPHEVKSVSSIKALIGTGIYTVESASNRQIILKVFKNHSSFKEQKEGKIITLPERYLIQLDKTNSEAYTLWKKGSVDGVFLSDISAFTQDEELQESLVESFFVRPEDNISLVAFNYESEFSTAFQNIENIKRMINPEDFNAIYRNNQLYQYYSKYDIDIYDRLFNTISIDFDNCDTDFLNYTVNTLKMENVINVQKEEQVDVLVYRLYTPTIQEQMLDKYIYNYYVAQGFVDNKQIAKEANIKLFRPVKYLLFGPQIKFVNTEFDNRNDFLSVFKTEIKD